MKTLFRLLTLFVLLASQPVLALWEDDSPLPVEEAFPLTATLEGNRVHLQWQIQDGYYLYKTKIRATSLTPGVTTGSLELPQAEVKHDEFFGEVEIYHHAISALLPIQADSTAPAQFELEVTYQGCWEQGICYPPHTEHLDFATPAPTSPAAAATGTDAFARLNDLGGSLGLEEEQFLPPEQAFKFDALVVDGNTLAARWQIADGHYLYKDRISFQLQDAPGITLGQPKLPKGTIHDDPEFGKTEIYTGELVIHLPLNRTTAEPETVTLVSHYQGCLEGRICYPPQTSSSKLDLPAGTIGASSPPPATAGTSPGTGIPDAPVTEQDKIAASLASGNSLLTILTFFGFGLLLAFTPCVFPMIPILSSIIIGQGSHITTRRAFVLSTTYVAAMALTYTVAGVVAGLTGDNLQAAFQNPWILGTFSAVFVLLSLSMFGLYDLQMPNFIQSRLTSISNQQKSGSLAGVAIMGFLSALIVGPCVAAPLAGALIYIGQTGDPYLGGAALFALSLGMGAPLIAIGTGAGKLLPQAGGWMNAVKAVFGVLLLAVAIWLLERILPATLSMLLWAILLISSAVYMGALEKLDVDVSGWYKLRKGLGFVALAYGVLLLVGVAAGGQDTFQPLRGVAFSSGGTVAQTTAAKAHFEKIKTAEDLQRVVAEAARNGQSVMLDFFAEWCTECHRMEKYTFSDPAVQQALANTRLVQADVTANDDQDKALLKQFKIPGPPAIIFFGSDGKEQRAYRVMGYMAPEEFAAHIRQALK